MGITGLFLQEYTNRHPLVTGTREPARTSVGASWRQVTATMAPTHLVGPCASPCWPCIVGSHTEMPTSEAAGPPPQPPQTSQTLQTSVFSRSAGESPMKKVTPQALQTSQTYPPLAKAWGFSPPRRDGLPRYRTRGGGSMICLGGQG